MVIWYIIAFLYFIAVDVMIFTQKWDWLIISLIAGAVFVFILLVTRSVVSTQEKQAPQEPEQTPQQQQQIHVEQQPVTSVFSNNEARTSPFSIALAFFYGELAIIIGLIVYLFVKS